MPAGTETSSVRVWRTRPMPRQSPHGSLTILPLPEHLVQVRVVWMTPMGVRCWTFT